MPGLPRPDVAPGPRRALADALHELHHRAGWPSLRAMAGRVGCSPTTMSAVFSSPRLPTWGLLELVVEALDGDVDRFRHLWIAAGSPEATRRVPIAGRVGELDAVRAALGMPGLLVVTGEAGIGKTTVVSAASADRPLGSVVARGAGLPLSAHVPLLPVADAFRSVWDLDDGALLRRVAAGCAPYVADTLGLLLPELGAPTPPLVDDAWRHRMLSAVCTALTALSETASAALVLEDLHWADAGTLDVVEYLVARRAPIPIVATWRIEDPTVPPERLDWVVRVARDHWVDVLELGPLTRAETAEQVALLGADLSSGLADRIFDRSLGQPLFTEQLASHRTAELPAELADLLDRRLGRLGPATWPLVRALGVAARPLPEHLLPQVTGMTPAEVADAVHRLVEARLVALGPTSAIALRHPLLAEAAARRTTAVERAHQHRTLATVLGAQLDRSPAEVAEHWRGAGDSGAELTWRLRAARAAWDRLALDECRTQWRRVLSLWPDDGELGGEPPVRAGAMVVEAIDAVAAADAREALLVAERAQGRLSLMTAEETAALYQRIGELLGAVNDPSRGLGYVTWALRIYERLPPSAGQVEALQRLEALLGALGRRGEGAAAAARGVHLAREVGDPRGLRRLLALHGWHLAAAGHEDEAASTFAEAAAVRLPEDDPIGDVELAVGHTDVLLRAAAPATEVLDAGQAAIALADQRHLTTYGTSVLRGNVGQALMQSGDPDAARAVVAPGVAGRPDLDTWAAHLLLAELDVMAGDLPRALERLAQVEELGLVSVAQRAEVVSRSTVARLWAGRPGDALDVVLPALDQTLASEDADSCWLLLVAAARAAADAASPEAAHTIHAMASSVRAGVVAAVPAQRATVAQELARAGHRDLVQDWSRSISAWDALGRPYDAAYSRWRAAEAARRRGDATTAQRLLRRAALDARGHRPLTDAILGT